jgi:hypothetical protein
MSSPPSDEITRLINKLNNDKNKSLDKGEFISGPQIDVLRSQQSNEEIITSLKSGIIETQGAASTVTADNIKLIILSLDTTGEITLDCDKFIDGMSEKVKRIELFDHVILGMKDGEYWVIGYNKPNAILRRASSAEGPQRRSQTVSLPIDKDPTCYVFKLKSNGTQNECTLLPEIIKEKINNCLREISRFKSQVYQDYYDPVHPTILKVFQEEAQREEAEVTEDDECNFMQLKLRSKPSDINLDYCKIEDQDMLGKLTENLHSRGIYLTKINDLIKEGLKEEEEEVEEGQPAANKNIISKEKQLMKNANDMYMIYKKVLFETRSGITYSSEKFFKDYYLKEASVPIEVPEEKQQEATKEEQQQQVKQQQQQQQQQQEADKLEAASIFSRLRRLNEAVEDEDN